MSKETELDLYFAEARSWDASRVELTERSTRNAWRVAVVATGVAAMLAISLLTLMPLKRVEPFVIRVDNTTGVVDVVPKVAANAEVPQAVTRYFLDHYVTVCERFNYATAESDYEECSAFHGAARNQRWYALWNRANAASPLNVHKDGSTERVQVSSVSFFDRASGVRDLAQVRYTKARRASATADEQVSHWIATIQYAYTKPSDTPKLRYWNPLGFKVLEFESEPEVLPASERAVDAPERKPGRPSEHRPAASAF